MDKEHNFKIVAPEKNLINIERNIRMIGRSINVVYYAIYLLTIIAVLAFFAITFGEVPVQKIDPLSKIGSSLQTVYLAYLLTTIPLALYWFHKKTLTLQKEEDIFLRMKKYKKAASIRLWVVGAALLIGVILVFFMHSQSMIFAAAMAAIALYFCKPSRKKLINELDLHEEVKDRNIGNKYV